MEDDLPENLPIEERYVEYEENRKVMVIPALNRTWVSLAEKNFSRYISHPELGQSDFSKEREIWLEITYFVIEDLEWLLRQTHHVFWSHMIYSMEAQWLVLTFLQSAPPYYMRNEFPKDEEMESALAKAEHLTFLVLSRLATQKESNEHHVRNLGNLLYNSYLFTIPMFFDIFSIYGYKNRQLTANLFEDVVSISPRFLQDLEVVPPFFMKILQMVKEKFDLGVAGMLNDRLILKPEIIRNVFLHLFDASANMQIFFDVNTKYAKCMRTEAFLSEVAFFYTYVIPKINNYIKKNKHYLFDTFEEKISFIRLNLLSIVRSTFCCTMDDIVTDEQNREENCNEYLIRLMDILQEPLFMTDYNKIYSIDTDLRIICEVCPNLDTVTFKYISDAVASCKVTDYKSDDLKEFRLASLITEVTDILPHLGDGFVEFCLKFYDYSTEKVVAAIIDDTLPPSLDKLDRNMQRVVDDHQKIMRARIGAEKQYRIDRAVTSAESEWCRAGTSGVNTTHKTDEENMHHDETAEDMDTAETSAGNEQMMDTEEITAGNEQKVDTAETIAGNEQKMDKPETTAGNEQKTVKPETIAENEQKMDTAETTAGNEQKTVKPETIAENEQKMDKPETTSENEQKMDTAETIAENEQKMDKPETTSENEQKMDKPETTSENEQKMDTAETIAGNEQKTDKPETSAGNRQKMNKAGRSGRNEQKMDTVGASSVTTARKRGKKNKRNIKTAQNMDEGGRSGENKLKMGQRETSAGIEQKMDKEGPNGGNEQKMDKPETSAESEQKMDTAGTSDESEQKMDKGGPNGGNEQKMDKPETNAGSEQKMDTAGTSDESEHNMDKPDTTAGNEHKMDKVRARGGSEQKMDTVGASGVSATRKRVKKNKRNVKTAQNMDEGGRSGGNKLKIGKRETIAGIEQKLDKPETNTGIEQKMDKAGASDESEQKMDKPETNAGNEQKDTVGASGESKQKKKEEVEEILDMLYGVEDWLQARDERTSQIAANYEDDYDDTYDDKSLSVKEGRNVDETKKLRVLRNVLGIGGDLEESSSDDDIPCMENTGNIKAKLVQRRTEKIRLDFIAKSRATTRLQ